IVKTDIRRGVSSDLDPNIVDTICAKLKVGPLLDRGYLDGDPGDREDRSTQEVSEIGLKDGRYAAPLIQQYPELAATEQVREPSEGCAGRSKVDVQALRPSSTFRAGEGARFGSITL